jgi:hypothetical protein
MAKDPKYDRYKGIERDPFIDHSVADKEQRMIEKIQKNLDRQQSLFQMKAP